MSNAKRQFHQIVLSRRAALALLSQGALATLAACGKAQQVDTQDAKSQEETSAQATSQSPEPLERLSLFSLASFALPDQPTPQASAYTIEGGLANVDVPSDFYLGEAQLAALEREGFFVDPNSYGDEFYTIYEQNRYNNHASFVTVDSLMHTYHLYFQHLLKGLERGALREGLLDLSRQMRDASGQQLQVLEGTEWDTAARANLTFFAVAEQLLDPAATAPEAVSQEVAEEVARVEAAAGAQSSLVTGEDLDYTQFQPRGYYEGDDDLERYFRAMMWYGQVSFFQRSEDQNRSALLMTLALNGDALSLWKAIYAITGFFAGASDDCGYYEYRPAVTQAYAEGITAADLPGNDQAWEAYRALTAELPAPQINSLPGGNAQDLGENKGFRFMGQRFTIDAAIFQQLIYSNVGQDASGNRRMLPDALDVCAALGSDEALAILDESGSSAFPDYAEHMDELRSKVSATTDTFWQASLYNQWLSTLLPLLEPKDEGYPSFMQSTLWTRKQLESFLGSYTELKHDTILYAKQAMAEGDGMMPEERDDRGYVEPEPLVFARLACLCSVTRQGLDALGLLSDDDRESLQILEDLASQLATIASKELTDELPTSEEFELIRSIGVQLEHFWTQAHEEDAERNDMYLSTQQFPASLVADVATGGDMCLELGTGKVRKLYAVVSVEGSLRVACGPVFSFYQFEQPVSQRLTDTEWRAMLMTASIDDQEATTPEPWTEGYLVRWDG